MGIHSNCKVKLYQEIKRTNGEHKRITIAINRQEAIGK